MPILKMKVLGAQLVKDRDFLGKMDPYVIVSVGSQKYQTKVAKGMGKTPLWNEEFIFNVSYNDIIYIKVYDSDIGMDDFAGETSILVSQLGQMGFVDNYFPLHSRFLRRNAGQIHIRFEWMGSQQSYQQQPQGQMYSQQPYGIPAQQYQYGIPQQQGFGMQPQAPQAYGSYPVQGQQFQPQLKPDQYGQMPTSGPTGQFPQQGQYQPYGQQQGQPGYGYNPRPY